MATVTAPEADFTGEVAGVSFEKGRASTADPRALAYFRRHGYSIDGSTPAPEPEPADPRFIGTDGDGVEKLGTPLRDAAVDPKPEDFLPPTNAGEANPHGPLVVAPEIHGSPSRPVTPGPVAVADPDVQEAKETAAAVEAFDVEINMPAKSASKAEWVAYAESQGGDDADSRKKAELIDTYGGEA